MIRFQHYYAIKVEGSSNYDFVSTQQLIPSLFFWAFSSFWYCLMSVQGQWTDPLNRSAVLSQSYDGTTIDNNNNNMLDGYFELR